MSGDVWSRGKQPAVRQTRARRQPKQPSILPWGGLSLFMISLLLIGWGVSNRALFGSVSVTEVVTHPLVLAFFAEASHTDPILAIQSTVFGAICCLVASWRIIMR